MNYDELYKKVMEMYKDIDVTAEYMSYLPENLEKDKKVVKEFLKAASDLVQDYVVASTDRENFARSVIEVYYMLRSQEKVRTVNEYHALSVQVAKMGISGKDVLPPPPDTGKSGSGFGIN